MLKTFSSSMYKHEETHEGDTVDTGNDDLELITNVSQVMIN